MFGSGYGYNGYNGSTTTTKIMSNSILMFISLAFLSLQWNGNAVSAFLTSSANVPKLTNAFARGATLSSSSSSSSSSLSMDPSTSSSSTSSSTMTRKERLIQKAKEIDPTLDLGTSNSASVSGSYCATGWSNRLGTVLTPLAIPGVYGADRPFYWNKIDVGGRMTVIELPNNNNSNNDDDNDNDNDKHNKPDLFIHSPVELDPTLQQTLSNIGHVKHIIAPNYEHVKYATMWHEAFPEAYMWACPGLMERMPEIEWAGEFPYGCRPPSFYNDHGTTTNNNTTTFEPMDGMWDWNTLQPFHLDIELNPFTGRPFFNEVVFFHTPSKTLLTTDVYWNYPNSDGVPNSNYDALFESLSISTSTSIQGGEEEENDSDSSFNAFEWELAPSMEKIPLGTRLWKFGMDQVYRPFYLNLMIPKDQREEFERCASFISGLEYENGNDNDNDNDKQRKPWPIETIVPAHGDILRGSTFVRAVMKDFFNL